MCWSLSLGISGGSAEVTIEAASRLIMVVARALVTIARGLVMGVHSYPSPIGVDALGNQARSSICGSGEVPNGRKADQSAGKTANQNVKGVAVGGIHEILHQE